MGMGISFMESGLLDVNESGSHIIMIDQACENYCFAFYTGFAMFLFFVSLGY